MFNDYIKKASLIFTLAFHFLQMVAQTTNHSGFVLDNTNNEAIIGASVLVNNKYFGSTNEYGFFSIPVKEQVEKLQVFRLGYKAIQVTDSAKLLQSTIYYLNPTTQIEEVEVLAEKIIRKNISVYSIKAETINKLPVLAGESDLMKTIVLLPGIQNGKEGTTGVYVRGGSPEQNLTLLDGVALYNVSHLYGFLSYFNTDAINDVKIIKGGFPARYGGRLSSVIDVTLKEGNSKKLSGKLTGGLIASKLLIEGPLKNENASFLFAARRSYYDIIKNTILRIQERNETWKTSEKNSFYDLYLKLNKRFSAKDRIYFSAFAGKDTYGYKENDAFNNETDISENGLYWQNQMASVRWNHVFLHRFFMNATVWASRYNLTQYDAYEHTEPDYFEKYRLQYESGITDAGGALSGQLSFNNFELKTGAKYIRHRFIPGQSTRTLQENNTSIVIPGANTMLNANEYQTYLETDWTITPFINTDIGVHASAFDANGKTYTSIEPRLMLTISPLNTFTIQAAYTQMQQYVHLLTTSSIGLPYDLWVPANDEIEPQKSEQYSLSFFYKPNKKWDASLEFYQKTMNNLVSFKTGTTFLLETENWENKLAKNGIGRAYGSEFLFRKNSGKTTGWIAYTYSRSKRTFDELNYGLEYNFKYDKPHAISVVINRKLNEKWQANLTWVFETGYAITLPKTVYPAAYYPPASGTGGWFDFGDAAIGIIGGTVYRTQTELYDYGLKNSQRVPDYHRMDVGFTYQKTNSSSEWKFGVYNVYSRANTFFIRKSFNYDGFGNYDALGQFESVSLFPFLPYVSYSYSF